MSNQPDETNDLDLLKAKCREYGELEASGANSRVSFARALCEAAHKRTITLDQKHKNGKDHTAVMVDQFMKGAAAKRGIAYNPPSSMDQQVSKFRAFTKLGAWPGGNGPKVFAAGIATIRDMVGKDPECVVGKRAFDNMVNLAREQLRKPDAPLTDTDIEALFTPPDKADKTEADILDAISTAMEKAIGRKHDAGQFVLSKESADILTAQMSVLEKRVYELGGTTKQLKEAQSKQAAAVAAMVKLPMQGAPAGA